MKFYRLNPDYCSTYLIVNTKNNSCVLIDPKLDYEDYYLSHLTTNNLILKAVIDTHTHSDHLSACHSLKEQTGCSYLMNENTNSSLITKKIKNHEILNIDGIILKCIHTPGHSIDSMCIIFEDKLLTGDTIFLDNCGGRDDLPTGNPLDHYNSLFNISKLPSHLIVYPSHNYTDSPPYTLHYIKKINQYFKIKNRKEFLKLTTYTEKPPNWMFEVVSLNTMCNTSIDSIKIPSEEGICQSVYIKAPKISPIYINNKNFNELLKSNYENIVILDVKEIGEINNNNNFDNYINIPLKDLPKSLHKLENYIDKLIITTCSNGNRASIASRILLNRGFKKVYVLSQAI